MFKTKISSIRQYTKKSLQGGARKVCFAGAHENVAKNFANVGIPLDPNAVMGSLQACETNFEKTVFLGFIDVFHREFSGRVIDLTNESLPSLLNASLVLAKKYHGLGKRENDVIGEMFASYAGFLEHLDGFTAMARDGIESLHKEPVHLKELTLFKPKIIIKDSSEEVALFNAGFIAEIARSVPDAFLIFPTGRSPFLTYKKLIELRSKGFDFSNVRAGNLDEYIGIPGQFIDSSYSRYLIDGVYKPLCITDYRVFKHDAKAPRIENDGYRKWVLKEKPIDLLILGIGLSDDVHLAFRQKYSPFNGDIGIIGISPQVRLKNASDFGGNPDNVVDFAHSFGLGTMSKLSKQVLLIAVGETKKESLMQAFMGPVTEKVPASILQTMNNVTVVCDRAASPF